MNDAWLKRWREGHIGWHEADGNRSLKRYWRGSDLRVLVPMCGKSVDLLWLAEQGNRVVGVECSEIAVRAFFDDNGLRYRQSDGGTRYEALECPIRIVCADYFDFDDGGFDAHYDRGALIALPPHRREAYAAHTSSLLHNDALQFVITVEYDQQCVDGPPFSVFADELLSYWSRLTRVDAYDDIENCPPKFRDKGLTEMIEAVWLTA